MEKIKTVLGMRRRMMVRKPANQCHSPVGCRVERFQSPHHSSQLTHPLSNLITLLLTPKAIQDFTDSAKPAINLHVSPHPSLDGESTFETNPPNCHESRSPSKLTVQRDQELYLLARGKKRK